MNKVILMGRLTRSPEVRYSQGAEPSELHSSGSESQSARRTSGAVPDMAVEDASGNIMSMMDGMTGGVSG